MQILPGVSEGKRNSGLNGSAACRMSGIKAGRSLKKYLVSGPPVREQRKGASYAPPNTT